MLQVTSYDVFATLVIGIASFIIAGWQGSRLGIAPAVSAALAACALLLSYARYRVEVAGPADALGYYIESLLGAKFGIGTEFMPFVTSLLTVGFGVGFLPAMMFFSLFGLLGMQICYSVFLRAGGAALPLIWHLLLLAMIVPSLGFWGSGIAKDSIVLLGISVYMLGVTRATRGLPYIAVGTILTLVIRPHIGLIMLVGIAIGYVVAPDTTNRQRFIIVTLASMGAALLVPITITYLGLGNLNSFDDVNVRIDSLAAGYEGSGSYVDISSMPLPIQIISYLLRPFPWEAGSVSQLAAALQNIVLLGAVALTMPALMRQRKTWRLRATATLLAYSLLALVVLAMTTANLGIASRQKWMVLVPLLLVMFRAVAADRLARAKVVPLGTPLVPVTRTGSAALDLHLQ